MTFIRIVIDSLRKDLVGACDSKWFKPPDLEMFPSESIRFTQAYPEGMPTLPFRKPLFSGKRMFPFDTWKSYLSSCPNLNLGKFSQ